MKIFKNIFKLLLISFLLINSFEVYGYGLVYKATFTVPNNSVNKTIKILTMAQASVGTRTEFKNSGKPYGTFISPSAHDLANTGSESSYSSYYYAFHPKEKKIITSYNPGFANNSKSNNIYYDNSVGEITVNSYTFAGFKGIASNIPENQNTNTLGSTIIFRNSRYNKHLEWTVSKSGVRLDINLLTNATIDLLLEKYSMSELINGIRFSYGLRTKDTRLPSTRKNMDTAWLYFQNTVGKWFSGGRGFNEKQVWTASGTGTYNRGASVANEFDNILKIPFEEKKDSTRKIYINHVDEKGNVIADLKKNSQKIIKNGKTYSLNSSGAAYKYQESYSIVNGQQLRITENTTLNDDTKNYEFLYEKHASALLVGKNTADAVSKATANLKKVTQTGGTPKQFACPSVSDVVVVNLVYKEKPPIIIDKALPKVNIIGRLEFINNNGEEYSSATTGHNIDYSPSTGKLTPYAQNAYPYIVRAMNYSKEKENNNITATSTVYITYKWQYWVFEHHDKKKCKTIPAKPSVNGKPAKPSKIKCVWVHTSDCKYYPYESSNTISRTFTYTVPYRHTWYRINNFKMYRIDKMDVYDNETNTGGILFGGGTYTVNPSNTYNQRFNNSRGKVNKTLSVNFPSGSYTLPSVYSAFPSNNSGELDAKRKAEAALNAQTHLSASNAINLTISYAYNNDYIELDGKTDMLQENYKSWSERITDETNTTRDLDSTRNGSGKYNTSNISYTSNLMSYMKPTNNLTTNFDFDPNYQIIPWNRENGIRSLQAKIFYTKVNDPKYNIGEDSFTSTDATYKMNNSINVSHLDFTDKNKLYKDENVNEVNVLTPISFGNFDLITTEKVDHSTGAGNATILQKNAEFTITPNTSGSSTAGYNYNNTRKFVKGYYYLFDFNIIYQGRDIEAFTPIYVEGANSSIIAKTTDSFSSGTADQITNSIKIVAITTNITDALKLFFDQATYPEYTYMDSNNNVFRNTNVQNESNLLTRNDIVSDAYHSIYKVITTKNIGRIFDFAITDCTDLAFKDVFRKSDSNNINMSTEKSYYSGYKKWNLYSLEYNEMINRDDIGTNPQTI
ncbi:MAG: hypothetical protein RR144_02930, partial [Clostridia bacterium]